MEKKTLDQWLQTMESLHCKEIELGLQRPQQVLDRLRCHRVAPLVILVGGTNGKGTTSALLSQLLQAQGLQVGVYSSPHIHRYNERVSINNMCISDEQLVQSFEAVEQARQDTSLTYFEFGTLAAFQFFSTQPLDACILEIGLGGRLDVVNLAEADLCIVTSIGLDHQNFLGDTVEAIAYEKCSIARPNVPLVCGQQDAPDIAVETVNNNDGIWYQNGRHYDTVEREDGTLEVSIQRIVEGEEEVCKYQLPAASIPVPNVGTAIQSLALLDRLPDLATTQKAVADCRVPGRLQTLKVADHEIIFDVGHNPQAAKYLASRMPTVDGILLAMLADKDSVGVVSQLPVSQHWLLAGLDCPRGLSAQQLAADLADTNVITEGRIDLYQSVDDALASWFSRSGSVRSDLASSSLGSVSGERGKLLVVGSFFTVEAAQKWLKIHYPNDFAGN